LSSWLGKMLRVPIVVDLYDNFESFGQARIPGFRTLLGKAVHRADMVITVSNVLREKVQNEYRPKGAVWVMPNGVDRTIFSPGPSGRAREMLGLPLNVRLVGTAGGLSKMKGLDHIFGAWEQLQKTCSDVHLVLAGPIEDGFLLPVGPRVHYLGVLPHHKVADLFRALDVGIISIADTAFGRYCFPQKAYEMIACDLPIVVSDVGEMSLLLGSNEQCLFQAGDHNELAAVTRRQLEKKIIPVLPVQDWATLMRKIELELIGISRKSVP